MMPFSGNGAEVRSPLNLNDGADKGVAVEGGIGAPPVEPIEYPNPIPFEVCPSLSGVW